MMYLIAEIRNDGKGGEAVSSGSIKEKLKKYIFTVWARKGKLPLLPMSIPDNTLNAFVNRIKAQCVFNLFDNVAAKTESRAVAEWSIRST